MQIQGSAYLHGAQRINSPHRSAAAGSSSSAGGTREADQLDISPEASLLSQLRDVPDIRADKVAAIRSQIANGTYDSDDKLDAALSRLLDEIA